MNTILKEIPSKLDDEQLRRLEGVREEWFQFAIGGDTSIVGASTDKEARQLLKPSLDWIYTTNKQAPAKLVMVLDSPLSCQLAAHWFSTKCQLEDVPADEAEQDLLVEQCHEWVGQTLDAIQNGTFSEPVGYLSFGYYSGLGEDTRWTVLYDMFTRDGYLDDPNFNKWADYLRLGPWIAIYTDKVAFVSRRPLEYHVNERMQLHNPHGPAVRWADGWVSFFVHGVRVEAA